MGETSKESLQSQADNPYDEANILSKMLFLWIFPFFKTGYKKDLHIEDLYKTPKDYESNLVTEKVSRYWDEECKRTSSKNQRPSLTRTLLMVYGKSIMIYTAAVLIDECCLRILSPLFLGNLVSSFSESSTATRQDQYLYAAIVCLSPFIHNFFIHLSVYSNQRTGFSTRVSTSSLMFRKATRLGKSSGGEQGTVGHLVNLLSNDVSRFDYSLYFAPYLIVGPIQVGIVLYFLWQELGPSSLVGVIFISILIPAQYLNGKYSALFRQKIAKQTDDRGRIMNEIIIAIRVIKMYAWEYPFAKLIENIRRLEVKALRKRVYLRAFFLALYGTSTKIIPYLTVVTFVYLGNELSADKVFFAVAMYNLLIENMLFYFPNAAAGVGETVAALNRIEAFLLIEEKQQSIGFQHSDLSENSNIPSVEMSNVVARWTDESETLHDINFNASGDRLVMIVGSVGSGKTSLLHVLISELLLSNGSCKINGKTSYNSQEPWIFSGNLRQNILFGADFEERRYEEITSVCALKDDFKQLPYGDMTIVGERGVALSGGQKARVNLARALYREADIYLLDDPLSAVDSRVSRHIFEKCVKDHLRGKLRLLATHQLQYLPQADLIIVLNKGEILAQGSYNELVSQGIDFVSLMTSESDEKKKRKESVINPEDVNKLEENNSNDIPTETEEFVAEGSVKGSTYWEYFRSGDSLVGFTLLTIFFIFAQLLLNTTDYWLSYWTDSEESLRLSLQTVQPSTTISYDVLDQRNTIVILDATVYKGENYYLAIYSGLVAAVIVICGLRTVMYFTYSLQISINLHNRMFQSLIRAPTKFFDDNPSGRVMNRFTKDIGTIDEFLPPAFYDALDYFVQLIGIIILVILSNYLLAVPAAVIFIVLWIARTLYVKTSRDVKRLESITKSPVFTHLSACMQGITTIRAFNYQDKIIQQFDAYQNIHSSAWFLFISASRSFGIWIDNLCVIFLTLVTFSFLTVADGTRSGIVGLVITSVMTLVQNLQWGIRQSAETENFMTCVERGLEYVRLEPEAALESTNDKRPPSDWPKGGEIELRNISLSYDDNNDVLKNLSFSIRPNEKIGIVGRTGAGKSSIISALFRMTEPRGELYIDGVLVNEIGLHELRKNISIIPQDPVLFSGTVRYNLDPFGQFEDIELWKVLEEVQLKEKVPGLDFKVADAGSNFSVGERQLVCLARAILKRNKILVMDEATANVDPRTDTFIQSTIRNKFSDCTIITIAHRLHTVMDSDRILLLENGHLVEYDHPHILLQNAKGLLYNLVEHTGTTGSAKLRQIAQQSYLNIEKNRIQQN